MSERIKRKKEIHAIACLEIDQRLEVIEQRLKSIKESRDNETKSSAGDKYETGRAMMQIEENNVNLQKSKILEHRKILASIDVNRDNDTVKTGTIVISNHMHFYISTALGKIKYQNGFIYCISINSPIGKALYGKQEGETLTFNNKKYDLLEVF